jgi:hypothetical protein
MREIGGARALLQSQAYSGLDTSRFRHQLE